MFDVFLPWEFYAAFLAGNLIGYFIFLILQKLVRLCYDAWLRRRQARQPRVQLQVEDRRRKSSGTYELLVRVEQGEAGQSRECDAQLPRNEHANS